MFDEFNDFEPCSGTNIVRDLDVKDWVDCLKTFSIAFLVTADWEKLEEINVLIWGYSYDQWTIGPPWLS